MVSFLLSLRVAVKRIIQALISDPLQRFATGAEERNMKKDSFYIFEALRLNSCNDLKKNRDRECVCVHVWITYLSSKARLFKNGTPRGY